MTQRSFSENLQLFIQLECNRKENLVLQMGGGETQVNKNTLQNLPMGTGKIMLNIDLE